MRLLFITDPLTHPASDSTVALYHRLPADPRFEVYHLEAGLVGPGDDIPVVPLEVPVTYPEFRGLALRPTEPARYTDFDLVYARADKPYPPQYLPGLIRQERNTRFVARPSSVLACDARTFFRELAAPFLPPGIMCRSVGEAAAFVRATGATVAKRNRSYGGKGVARIIPGEGGPSGGHAAHGPWRLEFSCGESVVSDEVEELVELLFARDPEPYEFVRFLPRVTAGDKRVLVVEGEIYGAFLRVARDGGWINNLTHGGIPLPATITAAEVRAIEATSPVYVERGLPTLGYDFLQDDTGEWILSEINASGNIGGYHRIEEVGGASVHPRLFDWLLELARR